MGKGRNLGLAMKPKTVDERREVAARIAAELARLREEASRADLGFLAYLLAMSEDEARAPMEPLAGGTL